MQGYRQWACYLSGEVRSQLQKEGVRRKSVVRWLKSLYKRVVFMSLSSVACSMASAGFAACMGASPEIVLQVRDSLLYHVSFH